MKNNFLLEIGTEELPSSYVGSACEQLGSLFLKLLEDNRIKHLGIKGYATNRRLIIYVPDVSDKQDKRDLEILGPPKNKVFDENGKPTQIGFGFAKSHGVDINLLRVKEIPKGEYVYIIKKQTQDKTTKVLAEKLPAIITSINFPKSMRWYDNTKFARPIRWVLCLYGNTKINFNVSDVRTDCFTYGHRFLSTGKKKVLEADDYFKVINKYFCVISDVERRKIITGQANKLAEQVKGKPLFDENLLEELVYISEYPKLIMCEFDKDFLNLPSELLEQVMKKHQKYIPIEYKNGELLNKFILVTNGITNNNIKKNNEKVLKAKFKDAEFFFKEDTKTSLDDKISKLNKVVWQENLGTLLDKTERLSKLSEVLAEGLVEADELNFNNDNKEILKRASRLCKIDLVTDIVREFTELQGVIGRKYALISGEKQEVADAIFEHYLPKFSGDILPETQAGIVLSIADKIDNIVGCFINNLIPTGSADPYALRRQTIGLINIIIVNKLDFSIRNLLNKSIEMYNHNSNDSNDILLKKIVDFIKERFENMIGQIVSKQDFMLEHPVRMTKVRSDSEQSKKISGSMALDIKYDEIRAVLGGSFDSIYDADVRVKYLFKLRDIDKFNEVITAFSRVINILPKKKELYENISTDIKTSLLTEENEKKLYEAFIKTKTKVEELFNKKDYENGFKEMSNMKTDIDNFFDKVMVMVEDENIKNNRLSLLKNINELFLRFADFSKLVF